MLCNQAQGITYAQKESLFKYLKTGFPILAKYSNAMNELKEAQDALKAKEKQDKEQD